MIMCVLLCYPVSIHMLQLLSTGRPISSIFNRNVNISDQHTTQLMYQLSVNINSKKTKNIEILHISREVGLYSMFM